MRGEGQGCADVGEGAKEGGRQAPASFMGFELCPRDRAVCLILDNDSDHCSSHLRVSVRNVRCNSSENAVCWREGGVRCKMLFSRQNMLDVIAFCTTEITGICFPRVIRIASFEGCYF